MKPLYQFLCAHDPGAIRMKLHDREQRKPDQRQRKLVRGEAGGQCAVMMTTKLSFLSAVYGKINVNNICWR